MKIVAIGSNIKVYVDVVLQINHIGGTYTNSYFGFNVNDVTARYDNLTILSNTNIYYVRDVDGNVLTKSDVIRERKFIV